MWLVLKLWISGKPFIKCFFRPEEVDDPSTTAREENRRRGLCFDELGLIKDKMNSCGTLRRGIIYCNFFTCEFVADQRQGVERSIDIELTPAVQGYLMKDKVQSRLPFNVVRHYSITCFGGGTVFLQNFVSLKHIQSALHFCFT